MVALVLWSPIVIQMRTVLIHMWTVVIHMWTVVKFQEHVGQPNDKSTGILGPLKRWSWWSPPLIIATRRIGRQAFAAILRPLILVAAALDSHHATYIATNRLPQYVGIAYSISAF